MKTHFILILLHAIALSGCANGWSNNRYRPINAFSSGNFNTGVSLDGSYLQDGFQCPGNPNVLPNDPAGTSGNYTVCQNPASLSELLIRGYANDSKICVFPVNEIDSDHVYAAPDPVNPSQPWNACVDAWRANSTGVMTAFPGAQFNAAFIVPGGSQPDMIQCLQSGNPTICPQYSYGKIR